MIFLACIADVHHEISTLVTLKLQNPVNVEQ